MEQTATTDHRLAFALAALEAHVHPIMPLIPPRAPAHPTLKPADRMVEDGAIKFAQTDLSKTGGVTESMRIAALTSAWKLTINPHTSATGINMAASIHLLAAVDNAGCFERDVARHNPFRDELGGVPYKIAKCGTVRPQEAPGIGFEIDEDSMNAHPLINGLAISDSCAVVGIPPCSQPPPEISVAIAAQACNGRERCGSLDRPGFCRGPE